MRNLLLVVGLLIIISACGQVEKSSTENKKAATDSTAQSPVQLSTEDGVATIDINTEKKEVMLPAPGPSERDIVQTNEVAEVKEDTLLELRRARTAFNNGIQYYKSGELDKASDAFKLSLTYKPDNDKAFYNLGKIYYDLNQKNLSLSFYEDAFRINPNDSASITAAGLIHFERGDFSKAMELYNMAIESAPAYGLAYYNRGTLLGQQKQYKLALNDLNQSIKYDSENANAYMNRGLAFFYMKRQDEACMDWQQAADMGLENAKKAVEIYCKEKPGN